MRYHINPRGIVGSCKADPGNCPFGSDAPHFDSRREAHEYYEASNCDHELAEPAQRYATVGSLHGKKLSELELGRYAIFNRDTGELFSSHIKAVRGLYAEEVEKAWRDPEAARRYAHESGEELVVGGEDYDRRTDSFYDDEMTIIDMQSGKICGPNVALVRTADDYEKSQVRFSAEEVFSYGESEAPFNHETVHLSLA